MHKRSFFAIAVALLGLGATLPARADLAAYLRKPEPAYKWSKQGEKKVEGGTVYDLHLVSQTWQGITWQHHLQVFRPDNLQYRHFCGLYNTGGSGSAGDERMGMRLATESRSLFAVLFDIPNQPLYGGRTEDALVVYTWGKYLETGDESWPLHFPMAKAVLKAMDAIQEFAKTGAIPTVDGFLVCGASKRGWTTWLAGASRDPRIKAIAPMVIDTLNLPAQVPHHLQMYAGRPSEEIDDYTRAGMLEKLRTPEGIRLVKLEDPYSYRDVLTLPKLLILGTNDRYWAQDALNLYWDGLKGPKWVLYTPNSGHGLEDRERVYHTLTAFIRAIASGRKWPQMQWAYTDAPAGVTLTLSSDVPPESARLFHVTSATTDFRDSHWEFTPMEKSGNGFTGTQPVPADGFGAIFGEATYSLDGQPFTLSTQIRILGIPK